MMKIAVVGSGAVGIFYGGKLCQAGHDTHFLVRSDFEFIKRNGFTISSPDGNLRISPQAARAPEEIGPCDLVLVTLKTTANHQFPVLLPPLVAPHTLVLTLQNGLSNEQRLAALFGPENILGALCFVCLNRISPGVVQHIAHGQIILGEYTCPPKARTFELHSLFAQAGVPCSLTDNLERAHWEKLVWNIPFNGLGVASAAGYDDVIDGQVSGATPGGRCLTTDQLLSEPRWAALVVALMTEVMATANTFKLALPADLAAQHIERTRRMGAYKPSTLVDYERGQPLELESLFLKPLRLAQAAGIATPRLEALCAVLKTLNPQL